MTPSMKRISSAALALAALVAVPAYAQRKSVGETGLVGIRLFDNGYKIVSIYGTPDDVQALSVGGGAIGGGGGGRGGFPAGGGAPGGFRGPGGPPGGVPGGFPGNVPGAAPGGFGGPGRGGGAQKDDMGISDAFGFADDVLRQAQAPGLTGPPAGFGGPGGPPSGFGGPGGPPSGFGGPPGGLGGGRGGFGAAGGGTPSGPGQETTFTRWIYNRNGSKYGFILDKYSRVVQIEAVGLVNPKVRTTRGIGFGANFAQIVRAYKGNSPDGYEIGGNSIVVRYLSRFKVAYRLTRLGQNKPHVVTGVVVAAGKG